MAFKEGIKLTAGDIRACRVRLREDIPDDASVAALYEQEKEPKVPWDNEPEAIYQRNYTVNFVWYGSTPEDTGRHELNCTLSQADAEKIHAYLQNR